MSSDDDEERRKHKKKEKKRKHESSSSSSSDSDSSDDERKKKKRKKEKKKKKKEKRRKKEKKHKRDREHADEEGEAAPAKEPTSTSRDGDNKLFVDRLNRTGGSSGLIKHATHSTIVVKETKEQAEAWLPGVGGIAGLTKEVTNVGRSKVAQEGQYTKVPEVGGKPHSGVFQGWPVRWTCCNGNVFICPCDPELFPEEAQGQDPAQARELTDEEKKKMAVMEARRAMQLAMHGVVKSSASFDSGGSNGWWKGSVLKQKKDDAKGGKGGEGNGEMPAGDWQCQSYNCEGVINFKKNTKCFKCGAARRF